jgi:hypothetical protein
MKNKTIPLILILFCLRNPAGILGYLYPRIPAGFLKTTPKKQPYNIDFLDKVWYNIKR